MTTLITGGAGFIGSNLARHLLAAGHEVRVLDDLSSGSLDALAGLDIDVVVGSILDDAVLGRAVDGADGIVHLAAIASVPASIDDPRATHDVNATGTLRVLEAARAAGGVYTAVASSSAVFGTNPAMPKTEQDWTRPLTPYGASKLATEAYANSYLLSYGMPTLAMRFFNVYGPGQPADHAYAAVVPRFVDAALRGIALEIHGDGRQSRDFAHVDTICGAIVGALDRQVTSEDPVHFALGTRADLLDVVGELERLLGTSIARQHTEARVGDVRASQADGVRFRALFPEVVAPSLAEGLSSTVAWHRARLGALA